MARDISIDAGAGVTRQIAAAGLRDTDIDAVFITHLHDDHTASLPAWMTFAYTEQLNEAPKKTFTIYGPHISIDMWQQQIGCSM
jgi:ribonuclease BN (tRNA processing enzyme)